jgi:hypothetical protein
MHRIAFAYSSILFAWLVLSGCESSTSPSSSGTGPELPVGSYFIQNDQDDLYTYEQYFVIQSAYRWEFVEYGYKTPGKSLCQITRQTGVYSATDSTLTITVKKGGALEGKCGMTKTDFNAMPLENAPGGLTETFKIRNVSGSGFESQDFFEGTQPGWLRYDKKPDPYGFY